MHGFHSPNAQDVNYTDGSASRALNVYHTHSQLTAALHRYHVSRMHGVTGLEFGGGHAAIYRNTLVTGRGALDITQWFAPNWQCLIFCSTLFAMNTFTK